MGMRFLAPALLALGLAGCASSSQEDYAAASGPARPMMAGNLPRMNGTNRVDSMPGQQPLQCVPYVREHSAVKLYGDAWTWWDQAAGKYERTNTPATGAVLVLHNYAGPQHGHVAVVKRVVGPREIRVDHANWLNDGSIYVNNPVMDVSAANDWSQVRVYNIQTGGWGVKIYPVRGFIESGSNRAPESGDKAPLAPVPAPKAPPVAAPPPSYNDDAAPLDQAPSDVDVLIAQVLRQPATQVATAAAPARAVAQPGRTAIVPVSARAADLNPPAGSPFALTADDLAIP